MQVLGKLSTGRTALLSSRIRTIPIASGFALRAQFATASSLSAMATARRIQLSPERDAGVWSTGIKADGAKRASEVLQEDLESHHVFFNNMGFHNHIVHHILTLYALGASPSEIQAAYDRNKAYQRRTMPTHEEVVVSFHDKEKFKEGLGKEKNYPNFLEFFHRQIEEKGYEDVLNEYLFKEDELAEGMFARLFGGLLHPLIHLGFALEFAQPALIAEALAQTAVHEDWTGPRYLFPVEKAAGGIGKPGTKSLYELLEQARADPILASSAHFEDGNKLRDGVLKRASEEMIALAAKYTVSEEQIESKVREMVDFAVYFTSTSQRSTKTPKFDFFYIHSVNSSIFFPRIISLPSLSVRTKLRLLEAKGRLDLLMYISRGAPELYEHEIREYPASKTWDEIVKESVNHPGDDGHLSKLVRALRSGEAGASAAGGGDEQGRRVKGDMWLRVGNMVNDSVKGHGAEKMWVRSTGFDQAWEGFEDRDQSNLPNLEALKL